MKISEAYKKVAKVNSLIKEWSQLDSLIKAMEKFKNEEGLSYDITYFDNIVRRKVEIEFKLDDYLK